jgi:Ca-activated chloride channel family protein
MILREPWMLMLALLIPLAIARHRRSGDAAILFSPSRFLQPPLPHSRRAPWLQFARGLSWCGLLLVVVSLAHPAERALQTQRSLGLEMVLCVDASSSMAARDLDPARTRLEVAQSAAAQFIAGRAEDRIGLIRFARWPDFLCPPTLHHAALEQTLRGLRMVEQDGPEDLTGIGAAVGRAAEVLRRSPARSRLIILLTDGAETVATAGATEAITPEEAADFARTEGIRIYPIVIGAEGAGAATAQGLAERSGGRSFTAADADGVAEVFAVIDQLEKSELAEPHYRYANRFLPVLGVALALLVSGRLLRARLEPLP